MEDLLKADIFFFVTTAAVVVLTVLLTIVLVYFVQILRKIKSLTEKVEAKAMEISADIDEIRDNIREKAEAVSRLSSAFSVAEMARRLMGFFRSRNSKSSDQDAKEQEGDSRER